MKPFTTALVFFASLVSAASTQAQSLTTELNVTTGYSTEARTWAGSTQLRTFGEVKPQIQFYVEGTWARRSVNTTDAFGAAYPYGGRVQLSEAYVERSFHRGPVIASVRGGQYRSPFGIYSRADHGYAGFLRAPLMRSEYYWSISNTMLERGVDMTVGTANFSAEVSVATPGDAGELKRQSGLDSVVRVQAYYKALVVGVSHINSKSNAPKTAENPGRMDFSGIDVRWTHGGIQLRGEWIIGKEGYNGSKTRGGYVDAIIHRPFMGPVTAVFRIEQLNWLNQINIDTIDTPIFDDWRGLRQTVGTRVRIPGGLTAQFNVMHHSKLVAYDKRIAFDMALTYSIRGDRNRVDR